MQCIPFDFIIFSLQTFFELEIMISQIEKRVSRDNYFEYIAFSCQQK